MDNMTGIEKITKVFDKFYFKHEPWNFFKNTF